MATRHTHPTIAGRILATIGVLILLVELGLYWTAPFLRRAPYAIHAAPVAIGCMLGFVGFYMLDHRGALEGGRFVVQSAAGLLAIVRGGAKRSGDLVLGEVKSLQERMSGQAMRADPVVTEEHDG